MQFRIKFLNLYILKEFIRPLVLSIVSFISIFIVVELLQRIRTFHDNHVLVNDIALYYFYKTPFIVIQMLPIAVILATLISLGNLVKNNEIIALRSSGLNIFKIVSPIILFAFFLGIAVFLFNELVIPYTNPQAEKINNERIRKIFVKENELIFNMAYRGIKGELLFAEKYFVSSKNIEGVKLFVFNDNGELTQITISELVFWEEGHWKYKEAYTRYFDKGSIVKEISTKNNYLSFDSFPEDLSSEQKSPVELSFFELKEYIKKLKLSGREYSVYLSDLYIKTSSPFSSLIIILMGIPLALRNQTGAKSTEFGIGILISFIFWGTNHMFYSFGKNEILSPFISAWIGNLIFLTAGIYMMYKER